MLRNEDVLQKLNYTLVFAKKWPTPAKRSVTTFSDWNSFIPNKRRGIIEGDELELRLGPFPRMPYPHTNTSPSSNKIEQNKNNAWSTSFSEFLTIYNSTRRPSGSHIDNISDDLSQIQMFWLRHLTETRSNAIELRVFCVSPTEHITTIYNWPKLLDLWT